MKTIFFIILFSIACKTNFSSNAISNKSSSLNDQNKSRKDDVNALNVSDPSTWKGVNLPLLSKSTTEKNLSQDDFNYVASAGANVIRLTVHADPNDKRYVPFTDNNGAVVEAEKNIGISALKDAINMARNAHEKIIIDMHTMPGMSNGEIWTNENYWKTLIDIWTTIARVFKNDTALVAFDLMNEPNVHVTIQKGSGDVNRMFNGTWSPPSDWKNTPRDYNLQITNLIAAIRKVDPNRYVIVEGFGYLGNPVNYKWMRPIEGFDKIVYSFHMYVPTGLTMLGTKASEMKGNDENVQPFKMPEDESKIDKAFAPVLAFQKKYNVPVYVGEFGITDKGINGKDANGNSYNGACWLNVVINKMNEYKWGWTYWDFWTDIRKPKSNNDPRYVILNAAMKGQTIKDYCK
jgi:hypothetical protein